jgi:hypothetical protein
MLGDLLAGFVLTVLIAAAIGTILLRHPPYEGASALHEEMKSASQIAGPPLPGVMVRL